MAAEIHSFPWLRRQSLRTHALQQKAASFDHLVGAADQRQWDGEAERLGGLEVEDQLDFRRLHDRQVGWLLGLEHPAGVGGEATGVIRFTASVAHQAAGHDKRAKLEYSGARDWKS